MNIKDLLRGRRLTPFEIEERRLKQRAQAIAERVGGTPPQFINAVTTDQERQTLARYAETAANNRAKREARQARPGRGQGH